MQTSHIIARIDENQFRTEIRLSIGRAFPQSAARDEVKAEAAAIAAEFPKYVKAVATTVATFRVEDGDYFSFSEPTVVISAKTAADGVNGGVNEAGVRRIAAARKTIERLGIEVAS